MREVRLDVRDAVREYIAGDRKRTPTTSWLTRGHYHWQPHGPRNSLRRWQHKEPYWNKRGEPVVMRPHKLRDKE